MSQSWYQKYVTNNILNSVSEKNNNDLFHNFEIVQIFRNGNIEIEQNILVFDNSFLTLPSLQRILFAEHLTCFPKEESNLRQRSVTFTSIGFYKSFTYESLDGRDTHFTVCKSLLCDNYLQCTKHSNIKYRI